MTGKRLPFALALLLVLFSGAYWKKRDQLSGYTLDSISESISTKLSDRPSFYDIALKYHTDKVSPHHYERIYTRLLEPLRDQPVKFLEIGLGCDSSYGPGASYYTWLAYFPHVSLHFIEYDRECAESWASITNDGVPIYIGDQSDPEFLERVIAESGGGFDVIVDDGGHRMEQQRTSLEFLWRVVKPGGIYFVEDLETSYMPSYGGGTGRAGTFMGDLKGLWDEVNGFEGREGAGWEWSGEVERVELVKECVGIVKKVDL